MKQITQLFLEGQSPTLSKANRVTVTLSCVITEKNLYLNLLVANLRYFWVAFKLSLSP